MNDFEQAIADAEAQHRRRVVSTVLDFSNATFEVTLGCGHTMLFGVAGHPVKGLDIELRDELECDQCN